jgi:hypothetical protein
MAEHRGGYKVGKDGLTAPERLAQERAAKRETKARKRRCGRRNRAASVVAQRSGV